MWITVVLGVAAGWVLLAVLVALLLGRTVQMADRRRPRAARSARRRAASAFERVVEIATGSIPIIRPRV